GSDLPALDGLRGVQRLRRPEGARRLPREPARRRRPRARSEAAALAPRDTRRLVTPRAVALALLVVSDTIARQPRFAPKLCQFGHSLKAAQHQARGTRRRGDEALLRRRTPPLWPLSSRPS